MSDKEYKELVDEMTLLTDNCDTEYAHGEADDLLCKALTLCGYSELVEQYNKIDKWYS